MAGTVVAYGHFSTIHPGHIRYLKHAKGLGEKLIVAVVGDTEELKYPFTQKERIESVGLLGFVDDVIGLCGDDIGALVDEVRPDIMVLGSDNESSDVMARVKQKVVASGGKIVVHSGDVTYASSELLYKPERLLDRERRDQFILACKRQGISRDKLIRTIENMRKARILVLGDVVVDQYAACEALGISAEAPVVVVKELALKNFIGAAAVVAAHIKEMGASCTLVSVAGEDSEASYVEDELNRRGVASYVIKDSTRPTSFKKRYMVDNQKLFRVSRLEQHDINKEVEDRLLQKLEEIAVCVDAIVISDFVYGVVTDRVLQKVKELAERNKLVLIGDLQCSSQVGSVAKFQGYSLLCPNEKELRIALGNNQAGIEELSKDLICSTGAERLIVKLAGQGFIAYDKDSGGICMNQAFPALSVNPVDVTGAGDSMLAVMACGLASKQGFMETAAIACCVASLAVERMGNEPVEMDKLGILVEELL